LLTYLTIPLYVELRVRRGGHEGHEGGMLYDGIDGWEMIANVTVTGAGMGNVTLVTRGTFKPLLLGTNERGPYVCASPPVDACGSVDAGVGEPQVADPYLVMYVGVDTRRNGTVLGSRAMNVRLRYEALDDGVRSRTA
jgi:hypothetical protein